MRLFNSNIIEVTEPEIIVIDTLWKMGNVAKYYDLLRRIQEIYDYKYDEATISKAIVGLEGMGYIVYNRKENMIMVSKNLLCLWRDAV